MGLFFRVSYLCVNYFQRKVLLLETTFFHSGLNPQVQLGICECIYRNASPYASNVRLFFWLLFVVSGVSNQTFYR